MHRFLPALLLCLLGASPLFATHIVGGEITYRCLGNNEYEITLVVYRDCYTGVPPFDDPAQISIYDTVWNRIDVLHLPLDPTSNDTLPIILSNPCLTVPPNVCVHRTFYKQVVTLPFLPGGYTLVYQRCCRNQLILNIPNPLDVGMTCLAQISEKALLECNSSAVFNSWPPVAICIHEPINFDHGASDADGDSLVYRLCTPLEGGGPLTTSPDDIGCMGAIPTPPCAGPYVPVTWNDPPYNLTNVLGGDPLTIDPHTGFMTGIPNMIGNFVVGVCIDEYRDDTIISTTRRDFQYNVADCGQPVASYFAPMSLCDTLSVHFENKSTTATFFRWYFDWEGDLSQTSVGFSPTYVFPDTGLYVVALIAAPGNLCSDTFLQTVHVTQTFADASLEVTFPDCVGDTLQVQATDQSSDAVFGIESWKWLLTGPGISPTGSTAQNPSFQVTEPGDYQLSLSVVSGNGCFDTTSLTFTVPIPPSSFLESDTLAICPGDTLHINTGADQSYDYLWSPNFRISDITAPDPLVFPLDTVLYSVMIGGNGPCVFEKTVLVNVVDLQGLVTATAQPDTIKPGESSQLDLSFTDATSYQWFPPGSLSNPAIPNPVATPDSTTTYTVVATLPSGCTAQGQVTVVVRSLVCDEPNVFFPTGFSPNGDGENDVLKLESNLSLTQVFWAVYNRWGQKVFEAHSLGDAWDGRYKAELQPAETYGYYLKIGCPNGQIKTKQGNVTLLR